MDLYKSHICNFISNLRATVDFIGFNILRKKSISHDILRQSIETIYSNLFYYNLLKDRGCLDAFSTKDKSEFDCFKIYTTINNIIHLDNLTENHNDLEGYYKELVNNNDVKSYKGLTEVVENTIVHRGDRRINIEEVDKIFNV